jgi:LysR family transcriptional regulator, low CO2-responsive transcriptional regulator
VTLTQLNAFVLVARLGSVRAAAGALGVSESAVSQALTALRQDLGDQLIARGPAGMTLTPGGARLLGTASQIVVLGAEAHAAVRAAQGAPEQFRVIATPTFAEFIASPLMEAFTRRFAGAVEVTTGVAPAAEHPVLIANRLADVAFGPGATWEHQAAGGTGQSARGSAPGHAEQSPGGGLPIVSEPVFKYRLVAVTGAHSRHSGPPRPVSSEGRTEYPPGTPRQHLPGERPPGTPREYSSAGRPPGTPREWRWLAGPSAADPGSATSRLLARLGVPEGNIRVLPSQTAAWAAAADGAGIAVGIEHLVSHQVRRGELSFVDLPGMPADETWHATLLDRDHRSGTAGTLRRFLSTPEAMHLIRSPSAGVLPSRFKPPVYVTIWS